MRTEKTGEQGVALAGLAKRKVAVRTENPGTLQIVLARMGLDFSSKIGGQGFARAGSDTRPERLLPLSLVTAPLKLFTI